MFDMLTRVFFNLARKLTLACFGIDFSRAHTLPNVSIYSQVTNDEVKQCTPADLRMHLCNFSVTLSNINMTFSALLLSCNSV